MNLLPASLTNNEAGNSLGERTRALLSPRNLHYAGVGVLLLVNLYLLVQMGAAWHGASVNNADAFAQQQIALKTAQIAAKPLEGLDGKLAAAREQANDFSARRLPYSYSQVAAELGVLTKKNGVRLTGNNYSPIPVLDQSEGALIELNMDARLSGEYRALMQFINGLERDKQFFLIDGVTLTGAQSGTVNLRLRLTTYLRPPATEDEMKRLTALPVAASAGGTP